MKITKAEIDAFCEGLEGLEEDRKALGEEIAERVEGMVNFLELDKKAGKKAVDKFYKEWKAAKKDKAEFTQVDADADQLLLIAFPEFNPDNERGV